MPTLVTSYGAQPQLLSGIRGLAKVVNSNCSPDGILSQSHGIQGDRIELGWNLPPYYVVLSSYLQPPAVRNVNQGTWLFGSSMVIAAEQPDGLAVP